MGGNVGNVEASIITYTILGAPYYDCSIMVPGFVGFRGCGVGQNVGTSRSWVSWLSWFRYGILPHT